MNDVSLTAFYRGLGRPQSPYSSLSAAMAGENCLRFAHVWQESKIHKVCEDGETFSLYFSDPVGVTFQLRLGEMPGTDK